MLRMAVNMPREGMDPYQEELESYLKRAELELKRRSVSDGC